jgi:hypothetical protein
MLSMLKFSSNWICCKRRLHGPWSGCFSF